MVFATPSRTELNPNKPGKVRLVSNATSEYKAVCLSDELLVGFDLLHGLIGTIFRFREGPTALKADIESVFCKSARSRTRQKLLEVHMVWTINITLLIYSRETSRRTIKTKALSMQETLFSRRCGSYVYEMP